MFDPDLCTNFSIIRTGGNFGPGGWKSAPPRNIPAAGLEAASGSKAIQMIPEGDRVTGALVIFTPIRMYTTHLQPLPGVPGPGLADKVVWKEQNYTVEAITPWPEYGFWIAQLLRVKGN